VTALAVRVEGIPRPQGSKNVSRNGGVYEASRELGPWRDAIAWRTRQELRGAVTYAGTGPVAVDVVFWLPRPVKHYGSGPNTNRVLPSAPRFPTGRPDVDKLARAVLDGLAVGGAYAEDKQVVRLTASKRYVVARPESPCALIVVTRI